MRYRLTLLAGFLLLCGLALRAADSSSRAAAPRGGALRVRILYDNSGSMFPGYAPPGRPGTPRSQSGARYFYQDPEFQKWLADFVDRQVLLQGSTVSMSALTSQGGFTPADLKQVHTEAPISTFDIARAVRNLPADAGQTTYLREGLDHFTRGFDGLVWLITDNVVETQAGAIDEGVKSFFEALRDTHRFRSVHLFKLPFHDRESQQDATLAVYGILVTQEAIPTPDLTRFDRRMGETFLFAKRRGGDPPPPLFPGREHLKLKDLKVDPMQLNALEVSLDSPERLLEEGQPLRLKLRGTIQSHLTQHSVTAGQYRLTMASPFQPDDRAERDLGAQPLAASLFLPIEGTIDSAIPPQGRREIVAGLRSSKPISIRARGPLAWLRLAFNGASIPYAGTVRMSFDQVRVRLERGEMSGIFGIDQASSIFDFQDVRRLEVAPSEAPVTFTLQIGERRTAILLVLLAVLAALVGAAAALLARKRWYFLRITGTPDKLISLRRLGRHPVVHAGQPLGTLSRRLGGGHEFVPQPPSAALAITPTSVPDAFDVRFRDGRSCRLSIEPRGGAGKENPKRPPLPGAPAPAPPSLPGPSRPLPKIDRP